MKNLAFDFSAGAAAGPIVLDIETQFLSHEVAGGWGAVDKLKVALAATWDEKNGSRIWHEDQVPALLEELGRFDPVVSFNGERFDFKVLAAYGDTSFLYARSVDMLVHLSKSLGFRVKLDSLAQATLGRGKTGTGTESVEWWRSGDPELRRKVAEYCRMDVEITRDIYLFGKKNGYVFIEDLRRGGRRQVSVSW